MPSKPAPSPASQNRRMVFGDKKPPTKIAALLEDPVACTKIAAAWETIKSVGVAVIFDLPLYCKAEGLDASATVLAANRILTTLEVFKDQAELDRQESQRKPK